MMDSITIKNLIIIKYSALLKKHSCKKKKKERNSPESNKALSLNIHFSGNTEIEEQVK